MFLLLSLWGKMSSTVSTDDLFVITGDENATYRNYDSRSVTTGSLLKNHFYIFKGRNELCVLLTASTCLMIMTCRFCPLKTNEVKKIILHRFRFARFLNCKCVVKIQAFLFLLQFSRSCQQLLTRARIL